MRVGSARPSVLSVVFVLLIFCGLSDCRRTKKAGRSALQRINSLINEQITKSQPQFDTPIAPAPTLNPKARRHVDELSVNNPDDFFQGDVELSDSQAQELEAKLLEQLGKAPSQRRRRKVGRDTVYKRWDKRRPISYEFADSIPDATRKRIREALDLWERATCLRFLENGPDVDRLEFFDGGGCSSFVGRTGGTQGISISTPGCDVAGIIAHEVGHALGIFHEQARPDQDRNIRIHYDNIPISRWNNFYPVGDDQADVLGLPYDAGSVMHYGATGFAINPYQATISTLDKNLQQTIGQRVGPSFLDIQAINKAYKCGDHCPTIGCNNGGYPNPNNCKKCKCPTGFAGARCDDVQFSICGAKLTASTRIQSIVTPNYPAPFPQGMDCNWLIEAPPGGKIFLEFVESFDYECVDTCDRSFVEVKLQSDFRPSGYRFCCGQAPQTTLVSEVGKMVVLHRALGETSAGFRAKIWSDKDSVEVVTPRKLSTTTSAVFTLPPFKFTTTTIPAPPTTTSSTPPPTEPFKEIIISEILPTSTPTTIETTTATFFSKKTTPTEPDQETTDIPTKTTYNLLPGELFLGGALGGSSKESETEGGDENGPDFGGFTFLPTLPSIPSIFPTLPGLIPTTTSTTLRPGEVEVVSPPDAEECACGPWSEWLTPCTQMCGGCGKRTRLRPCRSDNCRREEKRACNFEACPKGTNFLWNNGEIHVLFDGCCLGSFNNQGQCSALEQDKGVIQALLNFLKVGDEANSTRTRHRVPIPD